MNLYEFDKSLGSILFCGVDEAGRGPLAGPVVAGAVILPLNEDKMIEGLNDSKKLTPKKREELFGRIKDTALSVGVGVASVEEIENLNILNATFLAMKRAVLKLTPKPSFCIVDGNRIPPLDIPARCVVKGDGKSASIAAASIVAKVTRDEMMVKLDKTYPKYGFAGHKGYGTKLHYEMISKWGITPVHRKSFLKNISEKHKIISNERGKFGEKLACGYLIKNNYRVIAHNYRCRTGEIDLIAANEKYITFVEVKLRDKNCGYSPKEAVTKSKQRRIINAAVEFLHEHPSGLQPRFDVIEIVTADEGKVRVNFIKNAFCAEDDYGFV